MFTASISKENFFIGIPFNIDYQYVRIPNQDVVSSLETSEDMHFSSVHIRADIYDMIKDHRHHFIFYHSKNYDKLWVDVCVDTDIDTFLLLKLSI